MIPVGDKPKTRRTAEAQAVLKASSGTIDRLRSGDLPKADPLPTARAAGLLAAKKTPELIPHCHPLPLDAVKIDFTIESERIIIRSRVETVWKTGVEIEALTAASVAALTLYDMLKAIDDSMEITGVRVVSKRGGVSDRRERIAAGFRAALIVTSDGCAQGTREDKTGPMIQARLKSFGIDCPKEILPDEEALIADRIRALCREGVDLILTTGGTGLGPRDRTVEAVQRVIDREVPGIMEAARAYGQERTGYSMLSRAIAGQKDKTLILTLPGSSKGVEETLNALFPSVLHAFKMILGEGHDSPPNSKAPS